ncbi:MAG: hypothetical protein ACYCS1_10430 [Gammaproteobacteria bacterium]
MAVRLPESDTLIRRHREVGTKRALQAVANDYDAVIRPENPLLGALAD